MYRFTKMEGTGNDYVYFETYDQPYAPSEKEVQLLSDRRFGVGGDGVVLLLPSEKAAAKMKMYNADGSSSAMCGNALRCVAYLTFLRTGEREFILESDVGLHRAAILDERGEGEAHVTVEIGRPGFGDHMIPFRSDAKGVGVESEHERTILLPDGTPLRGFLVSMGNPHFVVPVENPESFPVETVGPYLENHPAFPERTNIEFISIKGKKEIQQRTWERGSGETLSCGSGACATLVASAVMEKTERTARIHLRGGDLEVIWQQSGVVELRGPARIVFTGTWIPKK